MDPDERNLIFLHGAGETASAWDEVIAALPESWTCRAEELSEVGFDGEGRFDLDAAADRLLDRLDPEADNVICGLSLGAMIATVMGGRDDRGAVTALVLSGGQVRPPKWMMRLQSRISELFPESAFTGAGSTKAETLAMYEAVEAADLRGHLERITVPTAVWCRTSDIANRPAAADLGRGIAGAELRFVPGMGHDWHRKDPQAFAAHLREFLRAN